MTERLCQRLGYAFRDPALLTRALTHRSASGQNYERLEFLGDGLINFVVAEALFQNRSTAGEGDLSRLRASLVCEGSLAEIAERVGLGDALILGGGETKSGGSRRPSILADCLEAVVGAIYVDGGFVKAREVCQRLFADALAGLPEAEQLKDAKTQLQELLQGRGRPLPLYEVKAAQGPSHRQAFVMQCRLADSAERTEGQGPSRRAAEQDAAERMLKVLNA